MKRFLVILSLFFVVEVNAQISGSVIDDKKEPIIGASVRLLVNGKQSNVGTVTDFDGN